MINFVKITPSKEVLDKLEEEKAKVNGTYNLPEVVEALKAEETVPGKRRISWQVLHLRAEEYQGNQYRTFYTP